MKRVLCNQCGQSHVGWSLRVNCSCGVQFVSHAGGPLDLEPKTVDAIGAIDDLENKQKGAGDPGRKTIAA